MAADQKDPNASLSHYAVIGEMTNRFFGLLTKIVSAGNSFLVLSSLSVFQFGFYQLILSFSSLVRNFSVDLFDGLISLEMRNYFTKGSKEFAKKLFKESFIFKIAIAIAGSAAIFLGADIIARWYGQDVALLIKWVSIIPLINALQSMISIFSDSIVSFADQSIPTIKEFVKLAFLIAFLLAGKFAILQVIIAYVISEAAGTAAFLMFVFMKLYRAHFAGIRTHSERLMIPFIKTHGVRVFFVYSAKQVLSQIEPWLIKFFVSVEAVAYYSVALTLASLIQDFMPLSGFKAVLYLKLNDEEALAFIFKRLVKYSVWAGAALSLAGLIAVPLGAALALPKYLPAMPVFILLIITLPLYGAMKISTTTLGVLREYKILAKRLIGELLILLVGAVVLLPRVGVIGMGIIEIVQLSVRTWFLYSRLIRNHSIFRIQFRNLFGWDALDKEYAGKAFAHFLGFFKRSPAKS